MLSDLRKSINAILFERVTSPFFGTLLISWIVWNWKIIYLTFFISESKIDGNKIDYIIENYSDIHLLITFPLISTLVLITLIPFVSNGAYWLYLKFNRWKIDKKNEVEKKQLLSFEKSLAIRKELKDKEIEFEKLLSDKEEEIELLNIRITELEKGSKSSPKKDILKTELDKNQSSFNYAKLKKDKKAYDSFDYLSKSIRTKRKLPPNYPEHLKEYFMINDIIGISKYDSTVYFTNKGESLYREYFNENFE